MTFLDYVFLIGYVANYILTATTFEGYTYIYNRLTIALEGVAHSDTVE